MDLLISWQKMKCCENGPKSTGSHRNPDFLVVWEAYEPRDLKYKTPEDSTSLGTLVIKVSGILGVLESSNLGDQGLCF